MSLQPIELTSAAIRHIKKMLLRKEHGVGFRLSVKKTGCSGYSYVPEIIEKINAADIHFVAPEGLAVFIDIASEKYLAGLTVDFVEEKNQGLKQKRLVFINPQAKNYCGCGESFTIE